MSKAVLTIDDAPSKLTPRIIDYLRTKGIVPVINFIGARIDEYFDEAVYVAKSGIVIGNHSFTHPNFSSITLEECENEILKTEEKIDQVYQAAGVKREYRVFRFPYGDKGGSQAPFIQQMLKDKFHFDRLDDTEIKFPFWKENHLDTEIDMLWSFDFMEYQLSWNNGFTWDSIVNHIHDRNPEQGGALLEKDAEHILLIHDHEQSEKIIEHYFEKIIDYALGLGVEFVEPRFIKSKR